MNVEFEAQWEHDFLAQAGIRMPDPDIYLGRIIDYAIEQDFGAANAAVSIAEVHKNVPIEVAPHSFSIPVAAAS